MPMDPLQCVFLSKRTVLKGEKDVLGSSGQFSTLVPPITVLPTRAESEAHPGVKEIQIHSAY